MKMNPNTIFITGGGSGIGKGLAEAFHKLGNQVIIAGRREQALKKICGAYPGMRYYVLDVTDLRSIRSVAEKVIADFPKLNCVFNNAGVQKYVDLSGAKPMDDAALLSELNTNVLGLIRVSAEFIPHLKKQDHGKQDHATLVNVSSGLAFVPLARFPVYCATKAAVHSFTVSLRQQLKDSGVNVLELIPPYVDTELGGPSKTVRSGGPVPMPLDQFISETMEELAGDSDEIAIGQAKNLVAATAPESFRQAFAGMNR
jgi:uncharacterized oxidoreductase